MKKYLEIGKIVNTHGIHGQLKVMPWCDDIEFFTEFDEFYLEDNSVLKITSAKIHKNTVLVSIEGINNINEAQKYRDKVLFIDRDDVELPEDRVFIQDIIGLKVFDIRQNKEIGKLSEIMPNPANDIYIIKNGDKTYLVPAVKKFLREVNLETGVITVETIEGMAEDED